MGFILFANFIEIVSGSAVFQNRSSFISYSIKREAGCVVAIGRFDLYVRDPSSPHSKRPPDARCCAPDFFLEPASHDATRQQSRKGV
ncbi:hypothetical protein, partial [Pseudomonas putida]|uniref:hypothetical protein n=1 Tax=Pseudomonas putida TaxID=303 RepID=UPI0039DF3187